MITRLVFLLTLGTPANAQELFGETWDPNARPEALEIGLPFGLAVSEQPAGVVGGAQSPPGKWDDAVGVVMDGQYVGCTGTLVAPDVVVTAEHCTDSWISHVLIGSQDWSDPDQGEFIEVAQTHRWPGGWTSPSGYDVAVLQLREASTYPHRMIATECIIEDYLADGVDVHVAGFGATQANGGGFNSDLNEGMTVVQTADCEVDFVDGVMTGCKPALRPGGEIGAGGNGVDACFGDSGGPLYLPTPEGTFLVGVTSRAYLGVSSAYRCRDGGIYVRPDAVIDWMEERLGKTLPTHNCNQPPQVEAQELRVKKGDHGYVELEILDDGEAWSAEIAEAPEHGEAWISDAGHVIYQAPSDYRGDDPFVVAVTDRGLPEYPRSRPQTVEATVPVKVTGGCGCSQAGLGGGSALGWLGLLLLLRRRRLG